jgi:hypothetical protein
MGKHGRPKPLWPALFGALVLAIIAGFGTGFGTQLGSEAASGVSHAISATYHELIEPKRHATAHKAHTGHIRRIARTPGSRASVTALPKRPKRYQLAPSTSINPVLPTVHHRAPSGKATPSPSAPASQLEITITPVNTLGILGVSVDPLNLLWTPKVTLGGQVVEQGCRIDWTLWIGAAPAYRSASSCTDVLDLSSVLGMGDYSLEAEAVLQSGATAQDIVSIQPNG